MLDIKYDLKNIEEKRKTVKGRLFQESANIKSESFGKISEEDLYLLFELYDEIFLCRWFRQKFRGKIKFKLSRQLTRSAGNTRTRKNISAIKPEEVEFEVKISLNHLMNFNKAERIKYVGGIEAANVLDSLMLVFEHEICHVIEFLVRHKSSCSKKPFMELINNIFGHTEHTHKLVGAGEANISEYGLKPGDSVKFTYGSSTMEGFIQKMNRKATVMCPDKHGNYIDKSGRRYVKFYVHPESFIKEG